MRALQTRKVTRLYVINARPDRRSVDRYEAFENVVFRKAGGPDIFSGIINEIGQKGLRLVSWDRLEIGDFLQISFPNAPDHVQVFGRIVWVKPNNTSSEFEMGIMVEDWYGIVEGSASWRKFKKAFPKKDRRSSPR